MRKLFCLFMTGLLVLCGVPAFASGQQGAASGAGGADRAAALAEIGFNAEGYPIVSKPYSFTAATVRRALHGPFTQMPTLLKLEQKSGVKVEWLEIPEQSYTERKNLMLASNDLPDVFYSGITDPDILKYGQSGTFIPLDNLIEQYGTNIKALFTQKPDVRSFLTTPLGHIYTMLKINEMPHRINPGDWFINKTWLDKLGLALPGTKEEFQNVLRAFRDRDPNGNGKNDEIPFSFRGHQVQNQDDIASLFAVFGMADVPDHVMVKDGKAYFTANSDSFRNALVWFNQLFSEGLIDREAFTMTAAQYYAKGSEPDMLFGSFLTWMDEAVVGNERAQRDYTVMPPLMGVDGKRHWNRITDGAAFMERTHFAITSVMKHPEVAIRWVDLCMDWGTSVELGFGTWDICLKLEGDKIAVLKAPGGMTQDEFRFANSPASSAPWVVLGDTIRRMEWPQNQLRRLERLELYRPYFLAQDELFPKVFFLEEEENELATIRTDITDYVAQMRARFIIGTESIASGWSAYVTALNQMGLARYLELHQKALDRYYGN